MNRSLDLLDQIIEMAQAQENELKDLYMKTHQASKTLGNTSVLFYLRQLRELIPLEFKDQSLIGKEVTIKGKKFKVALATKPVKLNAGIHTEFTD